MWSLLVVILHILTISIFHFRNTSISPLFHILRLCFMYRGALISLHIILGQEILAKKPGTLFNMVLSETVSAVWDWRCYRKLATFRLSHTFTLVQTHGFSNFIFSLSFSVLKLVSEFDFPSDCFSIFQAPYIEEAFFPPLYVFISLVENYLPIYMWKFFLGSQLLSWGIQI